MKKSRIVLCGVNNDIGNASEDRVSKNNFGDSILRSIKDFAGSSRLTGAMSLRPKKGGREMEKVQRILHRALGEVFYFVGAMATLLFLAQVLPLAGLAEISAGAAAVIAVVCCGVGVVLRWRK